MAEDTVKTVRIRLKFSTGEEFEAEGDKYFIEQEKDTFLKIVGKKVPERTAPAAVRRQTSDSGSYLPGMGPQAPSAFHFTPAAAQSQQQMPVSTPKRAVENIILQTPALLRRSQLPAAAGQSGGTSAIGAATAPAEPQNTQIYPTEIWQTLCKVENGIVLLKRKHRLFTPEYAALVVLAAAKAILRAPAYGSIALSKSLKHSGFMTEGDRLDRILQTEFKTGMITFSGYKRSRQYQISDEGFARAYIFAEKIAADYQ